MATFKIQGDIDDPENFTNVLENLNRDLGNVEDRVKALDKQGFEVSFKVDKNAVDDEEEDVVKATIKVQD